MANPENIKPYSFDKRPDFINKKGRPKKIYTILKDKGFSGDDIRTVFAEMLFYNIEELKAVASDKTKPAIMIATATALKNAMTKGDFKQIKDILEQVIGRPKQEIQNNNNHNFNEIPIIEIIDAAENPDIKKI